ncbi:hypothetical protein [Acetobacter okinawensis]|nr:hypothetical protein [Acetobacter okinawensis]
MCLWPELITEPANYRPANPLHTPADIEPEWYFLPFYGMMQAVPFKLGGLLLSGGAVAMLFAVPWLDPAQGAGRCTPALLRLGAVVVLAGSAMATACAGLHHMQGGWLLVARLGMVGYYAYFLVFLPLSGRCGQGAEV